jgi:hypothetical protein
MAKIVILIFLMFQSTKLGIGIPIETSETELSENESYFEGDMELNSEQIKLLKMNARSGLINDRYRWEKNLKGIIVVPYTFQPGNPYSKNSTLNVWNFNFNS